MFTRPQWRYAAACLLTAVACTSTVTVRTTPEDDRDFVESVTGAFMALDGRLLVVCEDRRSFCAEDPCKKPQCHDMLVGRTESFETEQSNYSCDCYGCECTSVSEGVTLTVRTVVRGEAREALRTVAMRTGYGVDSVVASTDLDGGEEVLFRGVRWKRSQSAREVCPAH